MLKHICQEIQECRKSKSSKCEKERSTKQDLKQRTWIFNPVWSRTVLPNEQSNQSSLQFWLRCAYSASSSTTFFFFFFFGALVETVSPSVENWVRFGGPAGPARNVVTSNTFVGQSTWRFGVRGSCSPED